MMQQEQWSNFGNFIRYKLKYKEFRNMNSARTDLHTGRAWAASFAILSGATLEQ